MRRARCFFTVAVGVISFAGQLAMPRPCAAWDSIPAAALAESQALGDANYITDHAVQPAGYYDTRSRSGAPVAPQPGIANSNSDRRGPLFRGQPVKIPTLPFGRQSAPTPYSATRQAPQPTLAAGPRQPATQQRPTHVERSLLAGRPNASVRQPGSRMPQPISRSSLPTLAARPNGLANGPANSQPFPNSAPVSPWRKPVSVASPNATAAIRPEMSLGPADRFAADAHDLSTRAQTEQEFTQVIAMCRQSLSSQPGPATTKFAQSLIAWSLNRRGQLKAEAGHDQEAIADFDEAIRADANCWRAVHNRGVLRAQAGEYEKAFDDFANTIRQSPQFAKAYSNRAALFLLADNLDNALHDYERALELDPELAVAHRGCARVYQLLGRMDESLTHYDLAVRLAPADAFAASCRADLLTDLGRYADAAGEYNRALEIEPKSIQALTGSAWLLATCPDTTVRNTDLAIQRAQSAIEVGGDGDVMALDTLAAAQANAGDYAAAMESVRKAIELAPADEREIYQDRLLLYQQAKPYRIAPIEHATQQVSYESSSEGETIAQ